MTRSEGIIETRKESCEFPSPTGFAELLADLKKRRVADPGLPCRRTGKGALGMTAHYCISAGTVQHINPSAHAALSAGNDFRHGLIGPTEKLWIRFFPF